MCKWLFKEKNIRLKFIHVSTDEVFGDLDKSKKKFNEKSNYSPSSPYSSSKAASDLLVKAWQRTYNFPAIITNCSNNYGPRQNFEKLIPTVIFSALNKKKIPIYGSGKQIREWIHVTDHVKALIKISKKAKFPNQYVIGSNNRLSNYNLSIKICRILDDLCPTSFRYEKLIQFVKDRPGQIVFFRLKKIYRELMEPKRWFFTWLKKTISWYVQRIKT